MLSGFRQPLHRVPGDRSEREARAEKAGTLVCRLSGTAGSYWSKPRWRMARFSACGACKDVNFYHCTFVREARWAARAERNKFLRAPRRTTHFFFVSYNRKHKGLSHAALLSAETICQPQPASRSSIVARSPNGFGVTPRIQRLMRAIAVECTKLALFTKRVSAGAARA